MSRSRLRRESRYLTGRQPGEPPPTLFEYVPDNALVFAEESHVTIPQLGGMYRGDFRARRRWPNTASACRPAWTTGPEVRGMGRDAAADGCGVRHARASGRWTQSGGVFVEQVIRPPA